MLFDMNWSLIFVRKQIMKCKCVLFLLLRQSKDKCTEVFDDTDVMAAANYRKKCLDLQYLPCVWFHRKKI